MITDITEQEKKILDTVKSLVWGKVEVIIQNGKVVMITKKEDIKVT